MKIIDSRRPAYRVRRVVGAAAALFGCGFAAFSVSAADILRGVPPDIEVSRRAGEYMAVQTAVSGFSGVVLIARDGEAIFAKGYGLANAEWNIPNGIETKFRLGSITKQFTATLVMQLQQQGKLSVQDEVCKYLEPCPETWKPVTIHHLLSHTAGIPSYTSDPSYRVEMVLPKSKEEIVASFRDKPLEFQPGEEFRYSNSGYFLLGLIVEKVAGTSFERALENMILQPLDMHDSGYDKPSLVLRQRASGYSRSSEGRSSEGLVNAEYLDMAWPYAAGAMYSTVVDLLKWDEALYDDSVLPQPVLETMWTPVKGQYGYGWQIAAPSPMTAHRSAVFHGGGINGFSTSIVRYREQRTTVVVLANVISAPVASVARDLSAIAFGEEYSLPKMRAVADVPKTLYDEYAGRYQLSPQFSLTITREGDSLFVEPTGQPKSEIYPESDSEFFSKIVDAQVTFVKDGSGKVTHLLLQQNGQSVPAPRVE